ncbi:DsrE/DsrF/DrsH-like family protein [Suipraeoptans intestinalis]|uniref:DsrE/DsrF/DrsH-like family protein n=1 Tax=Suipraeoptans intestinalis TaxID=2606628 RepID=UPI001F40EE0D|nr:DsrE/DsrF/DrsH-like family protein [Suipraeoptans intestinalis]
MVVFSGDLDKAIASFIIATGAASMGKEVTMFFTFWGLNILGSCHPCFQVRHGPAFWVDDAKGRG